MFIRSQLLFIMACVTLSPFCVAGLDDGLIANYSFEGNANDASGNGHDGIENGGISYTSGISGQASIFDGIDDYIALGTFSRSNSGTYNLWVKGTVGGNSQYIMSIPRDDTQDGYSGFWFSVDNTTGQYGLVVREINEGSTLVLSSDVVADDNWHMLTYTFEGNEHFFYVDSVLKSFGVSSVSGNTIELNLGVHSGKIASYPYWYQGSIDELRIYDRILNSQEIKTLYFSPIAHYTFEGNANDVSGNGVDGTENGDVLYQEAVLGQGVTFDGGGYINLGDHFDEPNTVSITAWFIAAASGDGTERGILEKCIDGSGSDGKSFELMLTTDNSLKMTYYDTRGYLEVGCPGITHERWYHVAAVFEDGLAKLYLDGQLVSQSNVLLDNNGNPTTYTTSIQNTDTPCYIGNNASNTHPFKGEIDDLRIYDCSLPYGFITSLIEGLTPPLGNEIATDGLVIARYPFEGDAQDMSGNGHDGTINGTAIFGNNDGDLYFDPDRTTNYIEVLNPEDFRFVNDFGIGIWVKTQSEPPSGFFVSCSADLNANKYSGWYLEKSDESSYGMFSFVKMTSYNTLVRLSSGAGYADGNWHYVFVTVSSIDGMKMYIDGELVDSDPDTQSVFYDIESYLCIGNYINDGSIASAYLDDPIDDLCIYDRARSIQESPIAHYTFENDANDVSGNGINGTENGSVLYQNGVVGRGATFDGGSYIDFGDHFDEPNTLSISTWFIADASGAGTERGILEKCIDGAGSEGKSFELMLTADNCIKMTYYDTRGYLEVSCPGIIHEKWYHVATIFEDGLAKLYLNGQLVSQSDVLLGNNGDPTTYTASIQNTDTPFYIGNNASNSHPFKGRIDDLRVYDYYLPYAFIRSLIDGVTPPPENAITLDDLVDSSGGKLTGSYPNYTLHEDLFVDDYLYIASGSTILHDTSIGERPVLVIDDGKIFANGNSDNPITFTAPDNDLIGDYWRLLEIHANSQPGSIINNCIFEKADTGLWTKSPEISISNSVFRNCNDGLWARSPLMTLESCLFYDNLYHGVNLFEIGRASFNDCEFYNNSCPANAGAGLYANGTFVDLIIESCNFHNNESKWGGAIYVDIASASISNSTIEDNTAYWGGGLEIVSSNVTINNSLIKNNQAIYNAAEDTGGSGGGIIIAGTGEICTVTIEDSIIEGNTGIRGGGIDVEDNQQLTINNCEIKSNSVTEGDSGSNWGGGIGVWNATVNITDCNIHHNTADSSKDGIGGGIYIGSDISSTVNIDRCVISNNGANWGGGIYVSKEGSGLTLINSIVSKNIAIGWGNALYLSHGTGQIKNSTFYGNNFSYGICVGYSTNNTIVNSILWDNNGEIVTHDDGDISVTYSDVQGGWTGEGNISSDPLFSDSANDNLHLDVNSPCIDAGTLLNAPVTDFDGEMRPWDDNRKTNVISAVDMGADERTDTDYDGVLDYVELEYGSNPSMTDTDNDGLDDYEEIYTYITDPNNIDTDSDGMDDGWEVDNSLDPLTDAASVDTDADGLTNLQEYQNNCNPHASDTDLDGTPDGWEVDNSLDPLTDDASVDTDSDGLTNLQEYSNNTNPHQVDTDSDGMPDGWEVETFLDPLIDDSTLDYDEDGISNYDEYLNGTSHARRYIINTTADEVAINGQLSLREAILAVNTFASVGDAKKPNNIGEPHLIKFDVSLEGGVILLQDQLSIEQDMIIKGLGASKLPIDGSGLCRGFQISSDCSVEISKIKIQNCVADIGAGIYNEGGLTLDRVQIENNIASDKAGGIYNVGTLYIDNSSLVYNATELILNEGGICVGGCYQRFTLEGGCIYNNGVAILSNSTIGESYIYFKGGYASPAPEVILKGAGILNNGDLKLYNCTVVNNTLSSTRSFSGSGSGISSSNQALIHNTIVANNTPLNNNLSGSYDTQSSFNLFEVINGSTGLDTGHNMYGSVELPLYAGFSELGNYGSPTSVYKLEQSAALDAGNDANAIDSDGVPLIYDQRGEGFDRITRGQVDVGACESDIEGELLPDLVINSWDSIETNMIVGGSKEISGICQNIGWAKASVIDVNDIQINLYISNNPDVDWDNEIAGLELISSAQIKELVTWEKVRFYITLQTPETEGQYYFRAKIDDPNRLDESDESNNWSEVIVINAIPFDGGNGSLGNPYLISNANQLNQIRHAGFNDKCYELAGDIDLNGSDFSSIDSFSGTFDGNGYAIKGFTVPIFGIIDEGTIVKNLRLIDYDITGSSYLAAMCRHNYGRIERCVGIGSLTALEESGGFVYFNHNTGQIINCYSIANVTATYYGGTGLVRNMGGVVGINEGLINNCYFAGKFNISSSTQGAGVFVGPRAGMIVESFYDEEISSFEYSGGGTPVSTDDLKSTTFLLDRGWDFNTVWELNYEGISYPTLQELEDLTQHYYTQGDGSQADPFQISTQLDLRAIAYKPDDWDKNFMLINDIDMSGCNYEIVPEFSGVFDGGGHCLNNLNIYDSNNQYYCGLIAECSGVIENLGLINLNIISYLTGRNGYTGSLCGLLQGKIDQCFVKNSRIESNKAIGGISGYMFPGSEISNSFLNNCELYADEASGIVNSGWGGLIKNCFSICAMPNSVSTAGILLSSNGTIVENSFWDGDITDVTSTEYGIEKTTEEMQNPQTYNDAGWDLRGEVLNGEQEIWSICGDGYPQLTWHLLPADLICPEGVGVEDLQIMAEQWLNSGDNLSADIAPMPDGDGKVNLEDFATFANHWMDNTAN